MTSSVWCLSASCSAHWPSLTPSRPPLRAQEASVSLCRLSFCGRGCSLLPPSKMGIIRGRIHGVVCMAPQEERKTRRSPLDFPIEWERPKPPRRPDIFPQFSPMKTPLPHPLPEDPPEEDEEEEEEQKEEEEENPEEEESENPEQSKMQQ
ncbi:histone H3.v1-like [Zingiber officinale]|uniref:Uncharacterized protein n=1 Tax=Zingiber officinale TaxID=94328 RepID=A0A8J5C5U7_ZINOF|nr:histone H3.v1-like [Zingiber officinale]KAG6473172.1 hypothetical protein ZIOFF_067081 [Zingiber officinale]